MDWAAVASWSQPERGQPEPLDVSDSFSLYEPCRFSAACPRSFSDTNWMPVSSRMKRHGPQTVRAVVHEVFDTSIVIGSGSDATVVPLAFESCGLPF